MVLTGGCGGDAGTSPAEPEPPPDPSVATTITLSRSRIDFVALDQSEEISATVEDQNGKVLTDASVSWSSSDGSVARISSEGIATASGVGEATITAESGSATATAAVTVTQVPASIRFDRSHVGFDAVGVEETVEATVHDANEHLISDAPLTWTSSDVGVATVDGGGTITSVGAGFTRVSATVWPLSEDLSVTVNLWNPSEASVIGMYQGSPPGLGSFIANWAITDFDGDANEDLVFNTWLACFDLGCGVDDVRNPSTPIRLYRRSLDGGMEDVSDELLPGQVEVYTNLPVVPDLNRDGTPDVFFGGFTDVPPVNAPSTLLLSGGGRYSVSSFPHLVWAHDSHVADLEGDGCPDILISHDQPSIWRGDCSGNLDTRSFDAPPGIEIPGTNVDLVSAGASMGICTADFDADGSLDVVYTDHLVAVNTAESWTPHPRDNVVLEVDWSPSRPTIRKIHRLPVPVLDRDSDPGTQLSHDMRCRVGDLDGDGDPDIFVSSTDWVDFSLSQFQVYLNRGDFVFEDISHVAFPGRSQNMPYGFLPILRDLDGDGNLDLFFSGRAILDLERQNPPWLGNGDGTFRKGATVDLAVMAREAVDLVKEWANLPDWAVTSENTIVGEIAPIRRATGEYDFVVPVHATDAEEHPDAEFGYETVYLVLVPAGVRSF